METALFLIAAIRILGTSAAFKVLCKQHRGPTAPARKDVPFRERRASAFPMVCRQERSRRPGKRCRCSAPHAAASLHLTGQARQGCRRCCEGRTQHPEALPPASTSSGTQLASQLGPGVPYPGTMLPFPWWHRGLGPRPCLRHLGVLSHPRPGLSSMGRDREAAGGDWELNHTWEPSVH